MDRETEEPGVDGRGEPSSTTSPIPANLRGRARREPAVKSAEVAELEADNAMLRSRLEHWEERHAKALGLIKALNDHILGEG